MSAALRDAVIDALAAVVCARRAYEFNPGSYSHAALEQIGHVLTALESLRPRGVAEELYKHITARTRALNRKLDAEIVRRESLTETPPWLDIAAE